MTKVNHLFKKLSLLALVLGATTQVQAADVDLAAAQQSARTFMTKQVAGGRLKAPAATNLKLVMAEASVARPTAVDYYIFNADRSYVVIAGDTEAPEVLMYGEDGTIDLNNIPPGMQWLLNKYKYQIDGIKAGTMVPVKAPMANATAVEPLVKANWDQSAPYYNHTPTSGSRHTLTGCPATSLAMCYYRWKWPKTFPALAAISATTSGGVAAPALAEKEADWDNIIDEYTGPTNKTYTTAQADAVSWLMRYAGQAIPDYMYGTSASGADDPEIYQGVLNMGYTDAKLYTLTELVRSGWSYTNSEQKYTDAQWNEWMMGELLAGRPIEYLAYDITSGQVSGHAFNVFGCDANGKYYVNWGWSGDSNGYCTLHNFTTATGATGQSGSFVFKYGEAMIIGIEPPAGALTEPWIKSSTTTLDMATVVGTPTTATFTITGDNLTENVNLALTGDQAFKLSATTLTAEQVKDGTTVTVTYNPTAAGTRTATVTLTSGEAKAVTVTLKGTATLRKEPVVLQDATDVAATSFKALWADETPTANVDSYTLHVSTTDFTPEVALLDSADWTNAATLPSGWSQSGLQYYSYSNACYLKGNGYVRSKNYDLDGYDKVTVQIYTQPYNSGNTITVTTSADTKTATIVAGNSFAWYTIVVNCANNDYVKITSSGMPDMRYVKVYAGELQTEQNAPARVVSEEGDASSRIVTGITAKNYTINGLNPETTYYFRVKALYVDGTASAWSDTKLVTLLKQSQGLTGDVNGDGSVDVNDINILINIILGSDTADKYNGRADVNGDGKVDVNDVNIVVNIILSQSSARKAPLVLKQP